MVRFGQENNKPKKELNKAKIIGVSIIFIFIILLVTAIVLYNNNENIRRFFDVYIFRKVINEEKVDSIEIDTSKSINVFAYSKYLAILDQNVLTLYNKSGNKEQELDIEISNPIFNANGNYLCVADKGGQKIYLISNKNIVWQAETEGNISDINVNKNGYVSVVISGTSYKTVVQILSPTGNELFKKYLSSANVIDTDISNDNKYLAIAEADFSGIVAQSRIEIISIEDAQNNSSESQKYMHTANAEDLIINIKYNTKDNLVCMYDKHIDLLKGEENTELINLDYKEVLFADANLQSKIVKLDKKSDGFLNTYIEMQIINSSNTNSINTYKIENTPKEIYVQDNMIAINLGMKVLFINDGGWLVKEYQSKTEEIQNIVICNELAGIVSKNKINVISL